MKHRRLKKLRETFLSTYNYDHLDDQGDWEEIVITNNSRLQAQSPQQQQNYYNNLNLNA